MSFSVLGWLLLVMIQGAPLDVAARAKDVLASLSSQNFAPIEAQFTEQMTAALPAGRLAATWTALVGQVGSFKSCGSDPRVRAIADKQMVITPLRVRAREDRRSVRFDPSAGFLAWCFVPAAPPVAVCAPVVRDPAAYTEEDITVGGRLGRCRRR